MDDIYFSDLPKKETPTNTPDPDRFSDDLFSGEPRTEKAEKFVVNLPKNADAPADRTPKGKPVGDYTLDPGPQTAEPRQNGVLRDKPVVSSRRDSQNSASGMPEYTPTPAVRQSKIAAESALKQTPPSPPPRRTAPPQQTSRPRQNGSAQRRPPQRPKKKKHIKGKIIAAILVLILLFLLGGAGYGYIVVGKLSFDKDFDRGNEYISQSELMQAPGVKNILFIGSDARGDVQGQRSDTMLICSIDTPHHKVKLTSLLRDSFVNIPSKGYHTKLNAAFSYGGANLLVDTVESNFKIKIDDYVLIDFEGFVKLIDAMGGLDVEDVTAAEAKYLRETVKILYAKEGKNHFSGKASLWYCRIRYLDDDFHRTERQRKVIHAIISQALRKGPFKLAEIINEVLPYITTSINRNEVPLIAASAVFNYIGGSNPQHQIPAEDTWSNARVNGADVLKFDTEKNIALLKEFIYE